MDIQILPRKTRENQMEANDTNLCKTVVSFQRQETKKLSTQTRQQEKGVFFFFCFNILFFFVCLASQNSVHRIRMKVFPFSFKE